MINEAQMTLARDWRGEALRGWLASEKLNGCRVVWDGSTFWTRHGNAVKAPAWFCKGLPAGIMLDGEIWAGRAGRWGMESFKVASNAVRLGGKWFDDGHIQFTAFDAPQAAGGWAQRMAQVQRAVRGCATASAIQFEALTQTGDLFAPCNGFCSPAAKAGCFGNRSPVTTRDEAEIFCGGNLPNERMTMKKKIGTTTADKIETGLDDVPVNHWDGVEYWTKQKKPILV